jgi:hypothetical protein
MDLLLLEGEHHTFVNEHPFANSVKAVEATRAGEDGGPRLDGAQLV